MSSHLWFNTTLDDLLFFSACSCSLELSKDSKTSQISAYNAAECEHFEAFCNQNTTLPGTMSSRVTSLSGKLGPSPATFFLKEKRGIFPEKTGFQKF